MNINENPPLPESRRNLLWAGGLIVLAALAAYHNSWSGPFIIDDVLAIQENPTIRHLWPPGPVLVPPHLGGVAVGGRPALNLSFAVNYALGGTAVRGYHGLNLAVHIFASLILFGIVRRTLLQPGLRTRFGTAALPLALTATLLWSVHPLQTESVTYIVQRAESLMGLCYLLTLYGFIRGAESPVPARWHLLAVTACLLGMATKEVMVSAPVLVLLHDRTFVAGTFREAWRRRWRWYLGLAGTWLLLGGLVASTGSRGGTAGFNVGVSWLDYAATQFRAIAGYLWLSGWPHLLTLDYGTEWVRRAAEIVPYALIVVPLAVIALVGLWRRPIIGFLGVWFFGILAPTSLVPGTTQMMVEHRMYLPLVAVVVPAVLGIYVLAGRRALALCLVLAAGLGWLTVQRNDDYRSELALWSSAVAKRPGHLFSHNSLGRALLQAGRVPEALEQYQESLRLAPDSPFVHYSLGEVLVRAGRIPEAIEHYKTALWLDPGYGSAHYNLGNVLARTGRLAEAAAEYRATLRGKPGHAMAHNNLGNVLVQLGRIPEALVEYQKAVRLEPATAALHQNLGNLLLLTGRVPEAIAEYREVLRLSPGDASARASLARAQTLPLGTKAGN